jgi:hypothetical protein
VGRVRVRRKSTNENIDNLSKNDKGIGKEFSLK